MTLILQNSALPSHVFAKKTDLFVMSKNALHLSLVAPLTYLDYMQRERIQEKLKIVQKHLATENTPMMILDLQEATKTLGYFSKHLPFMNVFYAMKANSHTTLLELVKENGYGIDAASAQEVETAIAMGFDPQKIILANPFKDTATMHALFKHKLLAYTFDSEFELNKINQFRKQNNYNYVPKSICRLKPILRKNRPSDVQHDLSSKFGTSEKRGLDLIKLSHDLGLNPCGVSFHLGSNCKSPEVYTSTVRMCASVIEAAKKEYGIHLDILDVGGGFPNRAAQAEGVDNLDYFYETIARICKEHRHLKLFAEPGRAVAGPTGILVTRVIGKRIDDDKTLLVLDDGVYGCFSPIFHDSAEYIYFPADEKYHNMTTEDLAPYTLAGPTCDSFDTIASNVLLPKDLQIGDVLFVVDNGAYTVDIKTKFNGFQGAKVVVEKIKK